MKTQVVKNTKVIDWQKEYGEQHPRNKYIYALIIFAVMDTIGHNNGIWEKRYYKVRNIEVINEILFEFIDDGGITRLNMDNKYCSYISIFYLAISKSMLKYKKLDDEFVDMVKITLMKALNNTYVDTSAGITRFVYRENKTWQLLEELNDGDIKSIEYNGELDDNNCDTCIRGLVIGLLFHDNLELMVDMVVKCCRITNLGSKGIMAGITCAYFVLLAFNGTKIERWINELVDLLNTPMVRKYINFDNNVMVDDYLTYIKYWKKYQDIRFVDGKPMRNRTTSNMIARSRYHFEHFNKEILVMGIGKSSYGSVIMAYDALLDCDGKWEKMVYYSAIHPGNRSGVGGIAGVLYSLVYGIGDIPTYLMNSVERRDEMIELGKKLYNKFFLKEG